MKRVVAQMFILLTLLLCTGCVSLCRIDGPYKGKVIDSETKQPLEGVVVLGVWNKRYPNVAGSTNEFYDSVELLTDKNGEFNVPGNGLLLFSFLDEMNVVIYKAGYEMLGYGPWSSFRTRTALKYVQWDENKPTFLLRKMSYEERKKSGVPTGPNIDPKRQQLLTNEINKERIELYNPL